LFLIALVCAIAIAFAVGRTTGWGRDRWVPPHERHVQDSTEGDDALSNEERKALAELEALHLHRKHPYC
jgi:hypothetical protein